MGDITGDFRGPRGLGAADYAKARQDYATFAKAVSAHEAKGDTDGVNEDCDAFKVGMGKLGQASWNWGNQSADLIKSMNNHTGDLTPATARNLVKTAAVRDLGTAEATGVAGTAFDGGGARFDFRSKIGNYSANLASVNADARLHDTGDLLTDAKTLARDKPSKAVGQAIRNLIGDASRHNATQIPTDLAQIDSARGASGSNVVGADMSQQVDGDCVALSALKAFSTTPMGENILQNSVRSQPDGSYRVSFQGDRTKTYTVTPDQMKDLGTSAGGNRTTDALIAAAYQHFGLKPPKDAFDDIALLNLLGGFRGACIPIGVASSSAANIEKMLRIQAPRIGKEVGVVFSGSSDKAPDPHASNYDSWQAKNPDHEFALTGVDTKQGTISYTNPWDETNTRTMRLSDFARQIAGSRCGMSMETFYDAKMAALLSSRFG